MELSHNPLPDGNVSCLAKRYIFAVMAFFGLFISFMNRVDLSVGIVAMVKRVGAGKFTNIKLKENFA